MFAPSTSQTAAAPSLFGTSAPGGSNFFGTPAMSRPASSGFSFAPAASSSVGTVAPGSNLGFPLGSSAGYSFGTGGTSIFGQPGAPAVGTSVGGGQSGTGGTVSGAQSTAGGFNFGSGVAASTSSLGFGLAGGAPGTSALSSAPASSFLSSTVPTYSGLGGSATALNRPGNVSLSGIDSAQTPQGITNPKDLPVAPGLMGLVNELKAHIRACRVISDDIASSSISQYAGVSEEIGHAAKQISASAVKLPQMFVDSAGLKADVRDDLRKAEKLQKLMDTPVGISLDSSPHIDYLFQATSSYELELVEMQAQIERMEKILNSRHPKYHSSLSDILASLPRMKNALDAISARVHGAHEQSQATLDALMRQQRRLSRGPGLHGPMDSAGSRGSGSESAHYLALAHLDSRHEDGVGPSPFGMANSSAVVALANSLTRNVPQLPGMYGATQQNLVTGSGLGLFGPSGGGTGLFSGQPATTGTSTGFSFFKPPVSTSTAFAGFGTPQSSSSALGSGSLFGGNTLNTSSSGTLFSGSANPASAAGLGTGGLFGTPPSFQSGLSVDTSSVGVKRGKK